MNWLRRILSKPEQPDATGRVPSPKFRETVPTSLLLGKKITGLWGAFWSSPSCDAALFAYELDHQFVVVFSENPPESAFLECHRIDLDSSFNRLSQVKYGEVDDPRIFGCTIAELLVPADPEIRFPDTQLLWLSSGFGIASESSAPCGTGVSLCLAHSVEKDLVSMFSTSEWKQYQQCAGMNQLRPSV